ncbi:2-C-methyl-D-erythritol 4-phosphate cytidylyltransferase [Marinomonas sp. A3A]|uniref:2-C-methyl-D-erythritol 4-phosphate cytidylyltransferase n=1 Tax=Marinomonas sp. A3A TaxID=2065312 RepID=UPI001BB3B615|nr:2-C-methyl-D-erythritol 4-phosphate cytidylyltransferase [Marinomonas sp. A3A]QUX91059.1 2-C-methyl-D-erythritol 4-phosphate cytidylyltransferase [Marinomonas sp. A3A]
MIKPLWVIIPAAGVGQRMQANCPKQYLSLAGQTILDRTIEIFISHPLVAGVLIGVGENDAYWLDSKWQQHDLVHSFIGGKERSDTVQKGLRYLLDTVDVMQQEVLVHDAARPLLSQAALNRIIHHASDQGALLAMPAKDTVKLQVSDQPSVDATLDRSAIWLAQTPQKFPAQALLEALEQAQAQGVMVTDECSAMEFVGWHPDLVIGESSNIKITLPEDLLIAEALFSYLLGSNLSNSNSSSLNSKCNS